MKIKFKILLVTFLITLSGCSSISEISETLSNFVSDEQVLFLSDYENVKIVEQDSKLTGQNIHPVNISEDRIEGAFKLLLYRVGKKTDSLFPDNKLRIITDSISKGLSKASTKEDIIFTIESWYGGLPGTRLKDNRVVSGRVFYNKDGLNIIFGSVLREGFKSTTDPLLAIRNPDLKTNPYMPGSRTKSVKNPFALAVPPNSGIMRPRLA